MCCDETGCRGMAWLMSPALVLPARASALRPTHAATFAWSPVTSIGWSPSLRSIELDNRLHADRQKEVEDAVGVEE